MNRQIPAYCLRYGWQQDPFYVTADKPPYFIPANWDQLLDVIQFTYLHENALLTILGKPGCGKSVFIQQILQQIDSNTLTGILHATNELNDISLQQSLCKYFSLPSPAGETLEDQFDNLLAAIQLQPQSCLLIIDNAELLRAEVIQQLLIFIEQQTDYQMRLHIILIGNTELKPLVDNVAGTRSKPYKIRYLTLKALNAKETAEYVNHRIKSIDRHSSLPFNNETIKYIYNQSKGFPHHINQFANHVLASGKMIKSRKTWHINYKTVSIISTTTFCVTLLIGCVLLLKSFWPEISFPSLKQTSIASTVITSSLIPTANNALHAPRTSLALNTFEHVKLPCTYSAADAYTAGKYNGKIICPTTPPNTSSSTPSQPPQIIQNKNKQIKTSSTITVKPVAKKSIVMTPVNSTPQIIAAVLTANPVVKITPANNQNIKTASVNKEVIKPKILKSNTKKIASAKKIQPKITVIKVKRTTKLKTHGLNPATSVLAANTISNSIVNNGADNNQTTVRTQNNAATSSTASSTTNTNNNNNNNSISTNNTTTQAFKPKSNETKTTTTNLKAFPQDDNSGTLLSKLKNIKLKKAHVKKPGFTLPRFHLFD